MNNRWSIPAAWSRYSRNQLLPLFVYLSSSASDSDYADDSAVSFRLDTHSDRDGHSQRKAEVYFVYYYSFQRLTGLGLIKGGSYLIKRAKRRQERRVTGLVSLSFMQEMDGHEPSSFTDQPGL
ncbi:hypothetical protein AAC387_Pa01g2261 [Persea americana]